MVNGANSTALSKGAPQPEVTDALRLYSGRFCPFAERTRLVLNYKNVPYEIVNIDLKEKPEWYDQVSALGKVPLLEEPGNRRIVESLIIAEYVDQVHRNKPLLSDDPLARAKQKMLVEVIGTKITAAHQQTVLKGDQDSTDALLRGLDEVEELLSGPFFSGDQIGFVDLMVWPWFERLPALEKHRGISFPADRFPKITAWCQSMREQPAVKVTAHSTEVHTEFYKTRNANTGIQA